MWTLSISSDENVLDALRRLGHGFLNKQWTGNSVALELKTMRFDSSLTAMLLEQLKPKYRKRLKELLPKYEIAVLTVTRQLQKCSYYSDLRIRDVRDLRLLLDIYSSDASDVLFGENMFNFKNYKK